MKFETGIKTRKSLKQEDEKEQNIFLKIGDSSSNHTSDFSSLSWRAWDERRDIYGAIRSTTFRQWPSLRYWWSINFAILCLSPLFLFSLFSLSAVSQRSENKSDSNFEREGREVIKKICENLLTETELAVALDNVSGWSFYIKRHRLLLI